MNDYSAYEVNLTCHFVGGVSTKIKDLLQHLNNVFIGVVIVIYEDDVIKRGILTFSSGISYKLTSTVLCFSESKYILETILYISPVR